MCLKSSNINKQAGVTDDEDVHTHSKHQQHATATAVFHRAIFEQSAECTTLKHVARVVRQRHKLVII